MPTALEVGSEGARTQYVGFLIPKRIVKNGEERLVVLNRVAASVIEECAGAIIQNMSLRGSAGWVERTGQPNR